MLASKRLLFQQSALRHAAAGSSSSSSNRAKTIGFIGLGAMGREMAANLLSKTFQASSDPDLSFVVHDSIDQSVTRFLTANTSLFPGRLIVPATSPAGVASLASTIITMVPSSPQVKEVYLEESGILEGLRGLGNPSEPQNSTLCIDCTTLDPLIAVQTASEIKKAGATTDSSKNSAAASMAQGGSRRGNAFDMVDAPVSGGVVGARGATLSFMVGADQPLSFTHAEHTLLKMGSRAIHCGKNGNGLVAKIANNLLLGISMLATSEAMLLGTTHGLSPQILAHILNTSTGKCWSSEVNNPCPGALHGTDKSPPAEREYEGGFASKLQMKDLGLAMSAAQQKGVPVPLGQLATTMYEALGKNPDFMDKDFSVAFKALSTAVGKIPTNDAAETV